MDCSTPGFPVHYQLPELTQTHVHQVSDAIQPSHPLSPPSPPAHNLFPASESFLMSQLFSSSSQRTGASATASVLPMYIQDWFHLGLTGLIIEVQVTLKKIKSVTVSIFSPSICHEVMEPDAMILVFWLLSFKPAFSLSSFTFIKRLFSSSSLSAIRVVSSVYLRLLIFLPVILIPACASSSLTFHMIYSAYKLNKQGDNIQSWHTPFPIWNQSVVPCPVLTVASWPAYRFLKRQVRWSGIPISWRIFHSLCDPHSQRF